MVSLKIKKILLLVSLLNAIEAYSNDTVYSTSYNNGIESTPSYSTSAISSTGSSNKENAITSSSETTTMAGQYGESGSTTIIDEQETGTSSQYISVTTTTQTSDTMSSVKKSTEIATPSSSIVPTPLQSYSDESQISQTLSHNPKSVAESDSDTTSSESSSSVIISTSDSSAVPGEISPIITTDSQISKEEGTLAQTSSISETTRIAQMVTRVSQISSITAASTIDGFSSESTQTGFSSTVSFENSVEEEYAMSKSQLSESYSSSSTVYSGGESTADKTSSSPITSFSSSYSQTTSTETSESSRVAVGVSRPSSITQTTSIDSFSMSEVELSTYYDLSAGNYPDQELIVDRPATSSTAETSSEASQGVSRESNTFAVSSISTTNFIVSSASDTVVSTSSTNTVPYSSVHSTFVHATSSSTYISSSLYSSPSLSASVSSHFGVAPFPSAYISFSSVPVAVSSTYTSSPSAPVAVSSTYTSSPSAPVAVSSSRLHIRVVPRLCVFTISTCCSILDVHVFTISTCCNILNVHVFTIGTCCSILDVHVFTTVLTRASPSAPAAISSTYTSSPSAPAAISSTYTSSPSALVDLSSTSTSSPYDIVYSLSSSASRSSIATYEFSPSPSTSLPTSSTYIYFSSAYAFEFSSERYSTTSTIAPTQIHSTLSRITDFLLQTSMAIQSIVSQQISTSSTLNDEIHSSALSVFNPSASNLVETSLIISSTQASITSPKNSAKISSLQSQLSSSTKNPYDTANKNTETSGRSTVVSNFLYTSSAAKPDNEKFSATPTEITTISSSSHAYSLSIPSSHNSVTGLSHNFVDSSKSATSFGYSSSSISSIKLSKETIPASKSVSNTQERITSFTSTLRANSQSEKSEGRNSVGSLQSSHISSNPSLSTNTKVDSKSLSRKVSKTMGENGEETGLTTTKTQYKSSSETSGSYSRSFTKISIGPATTAVQTQASTNSVFTAPALSTYPTTPYPSPNSYAWLPTAIIVESSETGPTTASFNPSITGSLPNAIEPAVAVSEPINHTLITIGFTAALNYVFLVQNPLSSAQIFNFLPLVLKYPFSNTSSELDNSIGELSTFILSYRNPQTPLRSLAGLIDSGIPLGGLTLYGSGDGGYVPSLTSSSVLDSSKGNSQNIDGTYKYGALDDFINSFTDSASAGKYAVKIIIFLIVLTIGVLLWLFVAFFAFRHRNILLKRHPRNCIEKSLNNERELESTELSRSSSGNQVYNEKPPESENESVYSAVDDHYIVTGENTVYNTIHRLHYTINDDGDLLYRDAIPLDFDQTNGDDGSGIDSIVRDCVYDKNQDATEAFLNDEESISGILDVDENGDIRLYDSYSDNEESNSFHLPDEVIENYNKNHLCETKLHGLGTESCTTDDPDTGNQVTNEFSTGSQTCLPSTAYTTPLHTNSIKLHTLRYTESSLPKPNQTLFSNLEDLEIEDIDDNGSVSDVHIEELDALDEELYKRMSKVIKQQNHQTTKI
ncbi:ANM_collapsed_G0012760.mRNA.1.CDS.1 [Saccharomyces cerevisiae]|nr:ANM_collapsed_G0012760.mRNA.1.CDS.1 [Saccharomyces cerevisiae]